MGKITLLLVFSLAAMILIISTKPASALCCFPYGMNHYVDPVTGNLVLNGELTNDSYRQEPNIQDNVHSRSMFYT